MGTINQLQQGAGDLESIYTLNQTAVHIWELLDGTAKGAEIRDKMTEEIDGQFWMYGTPWHGDFKEHSSDGLPVRKLFFLNHGEKNSARAKSGAEAVSMLLVRSFPPFWDNQGMEFTIEFCQRLAGQVPCYEITFVPDTAMIDVG